MSVVLLVHPLAALSVVCPRCHAGGGEPCKSTGGGNYTTVPTHKARLTRVTGLTAAQAGAAVDMVREVGSRWWGQAARFAEFEAIAAPLHTTPSRQASPTGVRLSVPQATAVEQAAKSGGELGASAAHFHGDANRRQTAQALETKGIIVYDRLSDDGYDRIYRLTPYGWQVYRQHRLIIRRMSDAEVDAAESAARAVLVRRTAAALVVA